jgi:lipopolysaccharide transport system ATP-binding protein
VQAMLEPDVLIVDEALAVGDEKFQRKCYARLDELRTQGTAVLLVTHSTPTVEKYCQRAMLLDQGTVHGLGASKEIVDQYHALLYADEKAYLRFLNTSDRRTGEEGARSSHPGQPAESADSSPVETLVPAQESAPATEPPSLARPASLDRSLSTSRAHIEAVWIHDRMGEGREVFDSGEQVEVGFRLRVFQRVPKLQVGMRIRTTEGVTAYGTSTYYHDGVLAEVDAGKTYVARFRFLLDLCQGIYFISVAAAETVSATDMLYVDKRTDTLMIKIREHPISGSGIAQLHAEAFFEAATEMEMDAQAQAAWAQERQ